MLTWFTWETHWGLYQFVGSYATEFTIPAAYSAHVIGKAGGNINKLKEELGVKIDISDVGSSAGNDDFKSVSKKNKSQAKVNVVIQGIQTNVEAAKERIHSLVSSLADQTTLTLNFFNCLKSTGKIFYTVQCFRVDQIYLYFLHGVCRLSCVVRLTVVFFNFCHASCKQICMRNIAVSSQVNNAVDFGVLHQN